MGYEVLNDDTSLEKKEDVQIMSKKIGYNPNLFNVMVNKFQKLVKILIPDIKFNANHINPLIFDKYVKQHIESHDIVPNLYMKYIIDMSWEKFVVEYLKDAVEIGKGICASIKEEEERKNVNTTQKQKVVSSKELEQPKQKQDVKRSSTGLLFEMDKLIRENKKLKAIIEAEKMLQEMLTSNKVYSEVERKVLELNASQSNIRPVDLGETALPQVTIPKGLVRSKKRKPTVNQMIEETYKDCDGSMQDFLSRFDDNFLGENFEQIRKFARQLFVDGKIDDGDWRLFKNYESDFCHSSDVNVN